MIKIGTRNIKNVKLGNTQIQKVYRGVTKIWEWWQQRSGIPYSSSDLTYLWKKTNNDSHFTPFSDSEWDKILTTTNQYTYYSKAFETHYTIVQISELKAQKIRPTFVEYKINRSSSGESTTIEGLWASAIDREHRKYHLDKGEDPTQGGWTRIPLNENFDIEDLGLDKFKYLYIIMHLINSSYATGTKTPNLCVNRYKTKD